MKKIVTRTTALVACALVCLTFCSCGHVSNNILSTMPQDPFTYGDASSDIEAAIPTPLLEELDSEIYYDDSLILRYLEANDMVVSIALPFESVESHYVSEQVIAVVGFADKIIFGGISTDKGGSWKEFRLPIDTADYVYIGFTSITEGWIIYGSEITNGTGEKIQKFSLLQTLDGGNNWGFAAESEIMAENIRFRFASSQIGWAIASSDNEKTPSLYSTINAGRSWEKAKIEIPDNMLPGLLYLYISDVSFHDNEWTLSLLAERDVGYPYRCAYDFLWSEVNHAWVWDEPDWNLPDGIDIIEFYDYVEFYLYPPATYNHSVGWKAEPDIWILFNTADHLERTEKTSYVNKVIPYSKVKEMAKVLYADKSFDSEKAAVYWLEEYGIASNSEGYIYGGHWPKSEGSAQVNIVNVSIIEDSKLEVLLELVYYPEPSFSVIAASELVTVYQKCILLPQVFDEVQYFTLISSERTSG